MHCAPALIDFTLAQMVVQIVAGRQRVISEVENWKQGDVAWKWPCAMPTK